MSNDQAASLFRGNWFHRDEPKLDLTGTEHAFVACGLGDAGGIT